MLEGLKRIAMVGVLITGNAAAGDSGFKNQKISAIDTTCIPKRANLNNLPRSPDTVRVLIENGGEVGLDWVSTSQEEKRPSAQLPVVTMRDGEFTLVMTLLRDKGKQKSEIFKTFLATRGVKITLPNPTIGESNVLFLGGGGLSEDLKCVVKVI